MLAIQSLADFVETARLLKTVMILAAVLRHRSRHLDRFVLENFE